MERYDAFHVLALEPLDQPIVLGDGLDESQINLHFSQLKIHNVRKCDSNLRVKSTSAHLEVDPPALRVHARQDDGHAPRTLEAQDVGVVQDPGELLPLAGPVLI